MVATKRLVSMNESAMRRAIERKREGEALSAATWDAIVESYMEGEIGDEQMAAMLMACVWRGLSIAEATALTRAIVDSGATISYPESVFVLDKHSSGGVSDVVSLVTVPLVAACGVPVAKLSGRALGHTGGTIDKLETIPGFNVAPSIEAFMKQVEWIGCAIAAQSEGFVPADKRLYTLRDRTATVPSIGLIASSIVSKKIAGGANAFVFDVKCGSAAFMHDPGQATDLAQALVAIATQFRRKARAIVTDMNEPLGHAIGTGLEVIEARDVLRGEIDDERTREGCLRVAVEMLELAGIHEPMTAAVTALREGRAYQKFTAMIAAQGGDVAAMERLAPSATVTELRAEHEGYVIEIDAVTLGNVARELSAHDSVAGLRVNVRVGDPVKRDDVLAYLYGARAHVSRIHDAIRVANAAPSPRPFVYARI